MASVFRRETLIALRARRTACRIATDILYPRVDPPPLAHPISSAFDEHWEEHRGKHVRASPPQPKLAMLASVLWIAAILLMMLNIIFQWKFP